MTRPCLSSGGLVLIASGGRYEGAVSLADIRLPDNHCGMDLAHVGRLAEALPHGATPPVLLSRAGAGTYWLIEGRHRFVAHLAAGRREINAVVVDTVRVVGAAP